MRIVIPMVSRRLSASERNDLLERYAADDIARHADDAVAELARIVLDGFAPHRLELIYVPSDRDPDAANAAADARNARSIAARYKVAQYVTTEIASETIAAQPVYAA